MVTRGVIITQRLDANGSQVGEANLPPTLGLQYHFAPQAISRPYTGMGVNDTPAGRCRAP